MKKNHHLIFCFLIPIALLCNTLVAQSIQSQILSSSGYQIVFSDVLISSTVGEPVIESAINSLNMYSGFQQGTQSTLTGTVYKPSAVSAHSWQVSPNPGHGRFELKNSDTTLDLSGASLEIIDMSGRLLHSEILQGPIAVFDISGHDDGIYFIRITQNATQFSLPFILLPF